MKVNRLTLLVLIITLFTVSAAWCDVVADLIANDKELEARISSGSVPDDLVPLQLRESELFTSLMNSKEEIQRFIETAEVSGPAVLARFYDRLKFEIAQERRSDLSFLVDEWHGEGNSGQPSRNKKIAMIYGSEVNLLDGQWHNASDGRRFWVSNEYPDIVLSAAEYKKYLNSATTVED